MIRDSFRFCVSLAALALLAVPSARATIVDAVVAVVDREPILQSEILADAALQLQEAQQFAPDQAAFDREADEAVNRALEAAIENRLLLREARLRGVQLNEVLIEERLDEVRSLYPSAEAFQEELRRSGETLSDLRDRLRKQLLARRVAFERRRQFEQRAVISESDIAQFYQDNIARFSHPERIRLRQIFLGARGGDWESVEARAQDILDALEAGTPFEELAAAHSELPGAEDGGIVGWVIPGDLIDELETAAFALGEGEHSGLIRIPGGICILRVDSREASGTVPLAEARAEIEPALRGRYADARFAEWMAQLREAAQIRIYSFD
jgi:peptidyl-prolyl cis-trans isomerase SurA